MKLDELVQHHPDLLRAILAASSGAIGEIFVAEKLRQLGYPTRVLGGNARQRDLVFRSHSGEEWNAEVKSVRDSSTWWVKNCPDPDRSAFWIFVQARREPDTFPEPNDVRMWVYTADEAAQLWRDNPYNASQTKGGDIRRRHMQPDALDAWHKLPGPPVSPP